MSIGLPAHLRPQAVSRALTLAGHVAGLVCLIAAAGMVVAVQAANPQLILWPAVIALLPLIVMLAVLDRYRSMFFSVSYLIIGGASVYWFALTVMSEFEPLTGTDSFVLSLPRIALMFVGGVGVGIGASIAWCAIGLVIAEIAIVTAAVQTGVDLAPDGTSLSSFVGVVVALLLLGASQRMVRRAQPSIHRAARDEHLSTLRYGIEAKAAAVMHDTILGHLAAISAAPEGALSSDLQLQMERDLEILVGEEWLTVGSPAVDVQARAEWRQSQLFLAIQESRRLGLVVDISGDIAAAGRLGPARSSALGLAVKQCLINVLKHSGTDVAEVVVYGSGSDVSVMVIDSGRGFSETETGSDRLGLRQSVRRRMEAVGGEVQVWSSPGRGTSVMIRVPVPTGEGDTPLADALEVTL
ncbi:MAG: ATP-binding protein [Rhodoglobus sp.]|nr:ATP-binding protein [Rhodoglobus sp.]